MVYSVDLWVVLQLQHYNTQKQNKTKSNNNFKHEHVDLSKKKKEEVWNQAEPICNTNIRWPFTIQTYYSALF